MNIQEAINTIDKMKFFDKTKIAEIIEKIGSPKKIKLPIQVVELFDKYKSEDKPFIVLWNDVTENTTKTDDVLNTFPEAFQYLNEIAYMDTDIFTKKVRVLEQAYNLGYEPFDEEEHAEVKLLNRSDILIVLSSFLDCETLEEAINQVEANPNLKIQISSSLDD